MLLYHLKKILFAHCVRTSLYCYITLVRIYFRTDVTVTHLVLFKMQLAQMSFLALIVVLAQIQVSMQTPDAQPLELLVQPLSTLSFQSVRPLKASAQ